MGKLRELLNDMDGGNCALPLALWQLTLSGGDRSAYSAAEIDAADAALAAVLDACERAQARG